MKTVKIFPQNLCATPSCEGSKPRANICLFQIQSLWSFIIWSAQSSKVDGWDDPRFPTAMGQESGAKVLRSQANPQISFTNQGFGDHLSYVRGKKWKAFQENSITASGCEKVCVDKAFFFGRSCKFPGEVTGLIYSCSK